MKKRIEYKFNTFVFWFDWDFLESFSCSAEYKLPVFVIGHWNRKRTISYCDCRTS